MDRLDAIAAVRGDQRMTDQILKRDLVIFVFLSQGMLRWRRGWTLMRP
jgi:hypothetical protein